MAKISQLSPIPKLQIAKKQFDFSEAIREVMKGKMITRLLWNDEREYGFLHEGYLSIHTKGAFHRWLVNDGDLEATDWIVIGETK